MAHSLPPRLENTDFPSLWIFTIPVYRKQLLRGMEYADRGSATGVTRDSFLPLAAWPGWLISSTFASALVNFQVLPFLLRKHYFVYTAHAYSRTCSLFFCWLRGLFWTGRIMAELSGHLLTLSPMRLFWQHLNYSAQAPAGYWVSKFSPSFTLVIIFPTRFPFPHHLKALSFPRSWNAKCI